MCGLTYLYQAVWHWISGSILKGEVVIGFAILSGWGLVRDIQKHFNANRCSEPGMCRLGLPELAHPRSLTTLFSAVFRKPFQTGAHTALADAQATLALYVLDRHRTDSMFLSDPKGLVSIAACMFKAEGKCTRYKNIDVGCCRNG